MSAKRLIAHSLLPLALDGVYTVDFSIANRAKLYFWFSIVGLVSDGH